MFDLSFLSSENKRILEKLQERLTKTTTPQLRNETELLIQETLAKAKSYKECDLFESDELRSQLLNKINILARLGKSTEAFQVHLRDVEFHIQRLQMQETVREQQKLKPPEEPPNLRDKSTTLNKLERDRKRKQAFGRQRWQIGFDDE